MGDGDRPAEVASRVVPMRARTGARRVPPVLSPADVARRLSALERQVEEALGAERVGQGAQLVETIVEDALATVASGRAWLAEQAAGLAATTLGDASLAALCRMWWRVDVVGRERLPAGPALVVANRGSALLPYDALMTAVALGAGGGPAARVRPFVDEWLLGLPLLGGVIASLGAEGVSPARVRRALAAGERAVVLPEGRDAVARPYADAYRVGRFARSAVLRVAIEQGVPIVPLAIIGVDEVHPVLARLSVPRFVARLGLPAIPLTPTAVPLPTKWTLFVGDPLDTATYYPRGTARDPAATRSLVAQVRERLQGLVSDGLRRRRSIFL